MSEFQFNCMTHANHLLRISTRRHNLDVHKARTRPIIRAANREYRHLRREKISTAILNTCLAAASVIGLLVAIGFLTTPAA